MDSVKLFEGSDIIDIQAEINAWVEKEKPTIKNSSVTMDEYSNKVIAITYHINKRN